MAAYLSFRDFGKASDSVDYLDCVSRFPEKYVLRLDALRAGCLFHNCRPGILRC